MENQMLGLINAGEENRRLQDLVRTRSLSALPVGGRYRTIDFLLSNMVNSAIKNVGIMTRYNYSSLMDHVGSGKDWDSTGNAEDFIPSLRIFQEAEDPENMPVSWMG